MPSMHSITLSNICFLDGKVAVSEHLDWILLLGNVCNFASDYDRWLMNSKNIAAFEESYRFGC